MSSAPQPVLNAPETPESGPEAEPLTSRARRVDAVRVVWLICVLALGILVVLPVGEMLFESLTDESGAFSLANFRLALADPEVLTAALNSLLVAGGVAVLSALIAVPLAFGTSRTNMWGKGLVRAGVIVSIISPPFVMTLAYILLLGPNQGYLNLMMRTLLGLSTDRGPLNIFTLWGLVLLAVPSGVAFVYVQLSPAFEAMDPALEEASRTTGAGPWRTVFRVTLPMMKPAVLSGALLAFSISLAMYGVPHILGINVLTIAIRQALSLGLDFDRAATLAVLVTMMSVIALFLYRWSTKAAERYQTVGGKGYRPGMMDLGAVGRHAFSALGVVYGLFSFVLPYALLLLMSFLRAPGSGPEAGNWTLENYSFVFASDLTRGAILNSLKLSISAATIVSVLGLMVGYIVLRTRIRGRAVLDYVSILPVGIAGTALAAGLILLYLATPLRALGLYGTLTLLLLAYMARFVAFGVRSSQTAIMQVSTELEEASRVAGAGPLRTMWRVTIPLVKSGVIYGWILVFILAFPEVSASVMLKGVNTEVVSTALLEIWNGSGGLAKAAALGVIIFVTVGVLVLIAQRLTGRAVIQEGTSR